MKVYGGIDAIHTKILFLGLCQAVHPQTVFLFIDNFEESSGQFFILHLVDGALEHGLLDPLSEVQAGLCNPSKPLAPGGALRGNVIGNQDMHLFFSPIEKGDILIHIPS
jgi:hypothetical protein